MSTIDYLNRTSAKLAEPEFPETADLRQELADIAALYPREVLIAAIAAARKHPLGQRAPEAKP